MRRFSVTIPLLVACGLLVSACGSAVSAPVKSAGSAPGKKPAPARVTTQTVHLGRYTQVFDTALPANPAQASVVKDFRTAVVLWDKSTAAFTLVSPITEYVTGSAVHNLVEAIAGGKVRDVVPSGLDRMFKTRLTMKSVTSATITTCDDGSKFTMVFKKTGVADPAVNTPPNQQYIFETWQMTRLDGRWTISALTPVTLPDPRALPCQP
jgi:hypothetical protein